MILTTKGRYAVMAMVDLALQPQENPTSLSAIAGRQEIPLAYLEQIFSKLKRGNVVQSVRGPGGGYRLAKPAAAICIADIILLSEESIKMTRCDGAASSGCMAPKTRCLTHDLWHGLGEHIDAYLRSISLQQVIAGQLRHGAPRAEPVGDAAKMFAELVQFAGANRV
jgi:Rrf2 family transcriptional regulator, iron-sulfur cluster assembly transcription factor